MFSITFIYLQISQCDHYTKAYDIVLFHDQTMELFEYLLNRIIRRHKNNTTIAIRNPKVWQYKIIIRYHKTTFTNNTTLQNLKLVILYLHVTGAKSNQFALYIIFIENKSYIIYYLYLYIEQICCFFYYNLLEIFINFIISIDHY